MKSNPYVSVIIPAYNAGTTIAQTISSVLMQSFKDFEIIVVNDGSSDNTASIVEGLSKNDSRVKFISQSNRGVAVARNCAISAARGEFIAPIDADDLWHSTYLEKQIRNIRKDSDAALVYSWSRYIDLDGNIVWTKHYPVLGGRVFARQIYWNIVGNGSAILFKKSAALEFGGYDERVVPTEDFMLQLKISSRYRFAVTPEYLVGYRQKARQESTYGDRSYHSCIRTLEFVRRECEGVPEQAVHWALGTLHFAHAYRAYLAGDLIEATSLVFLAGRSDLLGTCARLALFAKQRARNGRLKRAQVPVQAPARPFPFLEARPEDIVPPSKPDLGARRLEYLRRLDEMADKQYKSLSESVSRIGNIRAGTAPRSAADCTAQEVKKQRC